MSLFNELKRRNVLRVGAAYVVTAWLAIQVVDTIFPAFGFSDAAVRFVTIGFAIGLVPVLIFTWAFELTPEGFKKDSEVDHSQPSMPGAGKKLDRIIMVVLALALGYFAFDKFVLDPERESALQQQMAEQVEEARQEGRTEALVESYGDKSIAVLAFDDMSSSKDQEYLSDGIAEELLNLLARIPELRVISRSSAFSYKGKDIRLTDIARELNVAHILEGSVRKAGNQVRITAQLIDARSDTHLWSETYDRELDNIFAIQDEIAATVTDQLKVTLLGDKPPISREVNPAAYERYLEARHVRRAGTPEAYQRSNELADAALAIEPGFARPWILKAGNYSNMANSGMLLRAEGYELAREAAETAISINPDNAGGYSALAWVALFYDNDLNKAASNFEHSLELDPTNLSVLSNSAGLLDRLRRLESSVAVREYIISRDLMNPIAWFNLAHTRFALWEFNASAEAFRQMLEISPDMRGGHLWYSKALLMGGDAGAACEAAQKEPFEPFRKLATALCAFGLGDLETADAGLNWLVEHGGDRMPYDIASVFAYRKDGPKITEWVGRAVALNDTNIGNPSMDPLFEVVLDDPKWVSLMQALGKTKEQLASIEFSVSIPE